MPADHSTPGHVDDATLAAFVDGGLDREERGAVELHLAACDRCRALFTETLRTVHELESGNARSDEAVTTPRPHARRWMYGLAGLAAAALVVFAVWLPSRGERPELRDLVEAVGSDRPFFPRLTGGFAYGEVRVARSGGVSNLSPDVRIAIAEIEKRRRDRPDATHRAAFGVASLVAGEVETAVQELEAAVAERPDDARFLSDLGAARLVQAEADADARLEHVTAALDALGRALARDPTRSEALFNKALALEQIGPPEAARDAWDTFIAAERDERWVRAAEERKRRIESMPEGEAAEPRSDNCLPADCLRDLEGRWFRSWVSGARVGDGQPDRLARVLDAYRDRFGVATLSEWRRARNYEALRAGWNGILSARAYYDKDDLRLAHKFASLGYDAFARIDSAGVVAADVHLATIAYRQRNLDEAKQRLHRAAALSAAQGFRLHLARCEWLLGMIAWQQLRPGEALSRTALAHDALLDLADSDSAAQVARVRADYLRTLGLQGDAWRLLTRALDDTLASRRALSRYLFFFEISQFAEQEGRPWAAQALQELAAEEAADTSLPAAVIEARVRRAKLLGLTGRRDLGLRELAAVSASLASSPDEYLEASAAHAYGTLAPPRDAVAALDRSIAAHRRLEPAVVPFLLLARAQARRALGDLDGAERDLTAAIGDAERWRASVSGGAERVQAFDEFFPVYAEAIDLALGRGDAHAALALNERFRGQVFREGHSGPAADDVSTLQASLAPGTAAVVAASLPNHIVVWTVTRAELRTRQFPITRPQALSAVHRLVEGIHVRAETAEAEALRTWLIGPLTELGRFESLIFVPDDVFARVPLAFLSTTAGLSVPTTHAPSLSAWARAAGRAQGAPFLDRASMLAVLDPFTPGRVGGTTPPLPAAMLDVSSLEPTRLTVLRGIDATGAAVLAGLRDHDIFHFSGHAVGTFRRAGLAGLMVSGADGGDTLVTGQELRALEGAPLRLAVLAGCSTSVGPASSSEGPQSVAWGLLAAGVPTVVATLWDVDDAATAELMRAFYEALRKTGPAEALLRAQQRLRDSGDARLQAPASWAGFVVMGASS